MYKLNSVHSRQNQKQIMHESNKLYMLQTGKKATRSVKNKNNFINNFIGDKFAMCIRWEKLTT